MGRMAAFSGQAEFKALAAAKPTADDETETSPHHRTSHAAALKQDSPQRRQGM
jgi:hypothetical protein